VMSKNTTLQATKRDDAGSSVAKRLRRSGIVPAVVYGAQQDNYSIQLPAKAITDLLHASSTENVLVNLQIEGAKEKDKMALIQAVQHDPLTGAIIHVDFHAVKAGEKINATVPLVLTGTAAGIQMGGLMDHQLHTIDVQCLPEDLPEQLEVDVTALQIGEAAHVSDIVLPANVEVALDGDVVVALVQEIRVGKEEAETPEAEGEGEEGAEGAAEGEGGGDGGGEGSGGDGEKSGG
ncbi:MAG: 50S ribosomal protein L25, partial [Verrucomicrobiota bacterium]